MRKDEKWKCLLCGELFPQEDMTQCSSCHNIVCNRPECLCPVTNLCVECCDDCVDSIIEASGILEEEGE